VIEMDESKAQAVVPGTVTLPKPQPIDHNGNGTQHPEGVVHVASDSSLSRDLLKAPSTFNEALAWTHISLHDVEAAKKSFEILSLKQWCQEFGDTEGIDELQELLTIFPAIGGYNRSQAIQSDVKIVSPEALGVKLDRQGMDSLRKAQKDKEEREKQEKNH
jgi:hypothetical protein